MRRALLGLAVGVALVLVVVMRACGGSTAPNETAASKSSPTRSDATTDAEPHEVDAGSTAAAERHPVGDDAAGAPTEAQGAGAGRPASSATVVAGRCICAGAPVVGAVVQIAAIATPDDDARRVSGSSDRSGVFSVSVPGGGARQLLFRCSAPGYATRAATLEVREGQAELQLGDVHMPIACSIEGYVRTADGAPVEDVIVVAEAQAELPRDLPHGTMSVRSTRSDAQGQYQLADLPAAPWRLVASKPGLRESAKSEIDARGGGVHQADFVVELLAPIEGIAMLENGSPVPGVGVAAFDAASGRRVSLPVRTSEEGRFHVRLGAADRAPDDVAIGLSDDSRYTATPVATTWGTAGVTLLLRARPAVRLRVVDAASGADVASYAYRLHATRELGGRLQQAEPTDGVCAIDVADPAATWIHVLPPAPYAAVGPIDIGPFVGADTVCEIGVRAAPSILVEVRDGAGAPVEGADIQLVGIPAGTRADQIARIVDAAQPNFELPGRAGWRWSVARANADGVGRLSAPELVDVNLYVFAAHAEAGEAYAAVDGVADGRRVTLELGGVPRDVRFTGEWPTTARVRFVALDDAQLGCTPFGTWLDPSAAPEARVCFGGPGAWAARLQMLGVERELVSIQVAAGAAVPIELRAGDCVLPSRELRVLRGDRELASAELVLTLADSDGTERIVCRVPVTDGDAQLPALPIAAYTARIEGAAATAYLDRQAWEDARLVFP